MEHTVKISDYPYVDYASPYKANAGVTTPGGQWVYDPKKNTIVFKGDVVVTNPNGIEAFEDLMKAELSKGDDKYGKGDTTLEFVRGIDPNFELGAIAKYISRIAHGDSRSETDIVKIATYAFLYWSRHYHASSG
jgi:hypothetical protein